MVCSSPLHGYYFDTIKTEYGNTKIFFLKDGQTVPSGAFPIDINCGHCLECRVNKSKEWATRSVLESLQYKSNYFVTLTYDDAYLPLIKTVSRQTGELGFHPQLKYEHIQKFMKDLRGYYAYHYGIDNIRFLVCGEYGEKFGRCHWHLLLFNFPLADMDCKVHSMKGGHIYYESPLLSTFWPYGFNLVTDLNLCTSAYVARYVVKKFYGEYEKDYQKLCTHYDVEPQRAEFINMSRRPGIASEYFKNDFSCDDFIYCRRILFENGKYANIPNYFKRVFKERPEEVKDFEQYSSFGITNKDILAIYNDTKASNFGLIKEQIEKNTSLNFDDYIQRQHEINISKLHKRDIC